MSLKTRGGNRDSRASGDEMLQAREPPSSQEGLYVSKPVGTIGREIRTTGCKNNKL